MRKGNKGSSKPYIRIPRGAIGSAWRTMFAFRTKRRKGIGGDENNEEQNLFFSLPAELQICILRELFYVDILSLRLASRSLHQLIDVNEAQIVRHHLEYHVPPHILELYPPPSELNLKFLSGLAQRQCLSCNLAQHLAEYISRQIRRRSLSGNAHHRLRHQRMRRRLVPLIFTLFHFFERYRDSLLAETYTGNRIAYGDVDEPIPTQQEIMESYNPALLLRVSETYNLLLYLLCQRLAPPNKTFFLARARSGRSLDRPTEDAMVKLLMIGGISQVQRIWSIKNHSRRRKAVEKWVSGLEPQGNNQRQWNSAEPQPDRNPTFGREEDQNSTKALEHEREHEHEHMPSSFGLPTPRLSASAIERLIPVLPPLRAVWVPSARGLILGKGLDTADIGVWELFIDELAAGDDSEDEREYFEDSGDEDPDDSGDESEGIHPD
ncbi:hypothetical protein FGG08_005358 [Glutinoglossum americanum]|uniref:F-box domain-containing protein n=1 Tax=Glutinoglossum americanum TaxID=1670608 RepID=A0A9P8HYM7_9PEZI|nr:hypothetical protein FGG08_005358 [Glutinoglossum americanum]